MSELTPVLRQATEADAAAVVALWRAVFPEYQDPKNPQRDPVASFSRKLARNDGLFWLAELDGEVVGTAMAGYDGHRGWLYAVGVHPKARRRGVAKALLKTAEDALRAQGCPKVNLQVLSENREAQTFWRHQGYQADAVMSFGRRL
jgi:ribosomal protein S18 acetylase RimI-like enzyme